MAVDPINQYPLGTDLLWMATYRADPKVGAMDGFCMKICGTLGEAAVEAQKIAVRENAILQCLNRRF